MVLSRDDLQSRHLLHPEVFLHHPICVYANTQWYFRPYLFFGWGFWATLWTHPQIDWRKDWHATYQMYANNIY